MMKRPACRLLGTPFAADLESGHCYTTMPGAKLVASCGYWDNSVRCYSVEDGRMLQSLRQHKDIVTCIAVGADGETLVTGMPSPALQQTCCPDVIAQRTRVHLLPSPRQHKIVVT